MNITGRRRPSLLAEPVFRRLWIGQGLASVTEALFLVCLTLLVLDVAGPGAAVGLVLAVAAVPRAVLLPLGGVLADRVAPQRIVAAATWLRTTALATLAVLVVLGPPPVVVVAVFAGLLGVLDAAYYPAALALLPRVVPPATLARANALIQGFESAGDLLGPAAAAGIVAATGLGGAFGAVTALSLLAAAALAAFAYRARTVLSARTESALHDARAAQQPPGSSTLRAGLRFARTQPMVRNILLILAVLNIAVVGPVLVGGAVLAQQHLGGAEQLGILFAGFGAGSLLGLLAAGARPPARRGPVLLLGTAAIGAGTTGLGLVTTLPMAVTVAAVIGIGQGYLGVVLVAWLQAHVPDDLRGRVMSLVVVAVVAFDPLSYALAGALLPAGTTLLFSLCGSIVLLTTAAAATSPTLRSCL